MHVHVCASATHEHTYYMFGEEDYKINRVSRFSPPGELSIIPKHVPSPTQSTLDWVRHQQLPELINIMYMYNYMQQYGRHHLTEVCACHVITHTCSTLEMLESILMMPATTTSAAWLRLVWATSSSRTGRQSADTSA